MIIVALQAILLPLIVYVAMSRRWPKFVITQDMVIFACCCAVGLYHVAHFESEAASLRISVSFIVALIAILFVRIIHLIIKRKAAPPEETQPTTHTEQYFFVWALVYVLYLNLA